GHNGKFRAALISETPWQLADQLHRLINRLSEGLTLDEIHTPQEGLNTAEARDNPKLAALFPGQGSQRLNMAEQLLKRFDFTREMQQDFDQRMARLTGEPLRNRLFRDLLGADTETRRQWEEALRDTLLQQPAIVATSMIILRLLEHLGLEPSYATGHSLGEIGALAAGGALQPEDAFQLAVVRAQAMSQVAGKGAGGMAAIGTDAESLQGLLAQHDLKLVISNYNATQQNVVSGPSAEIERVLGICAKQDIWARRLPVSHAFHSEAVASAAGTLREGLEQIPMAELNRAAVYSTSTASRLTADTDLRALLTQQIVRPVRFVDVIQEIAAEQPDLWVEIGPGQILSGLARDTLGADKLEVYATDLAQEDGFQLLNRLLARTFVLGFPVRTKRLFDGRFHREFDPYHYAPQLIVNPCERPVKPLEKPLSLSTGGLSGELTPESASESAFASYLTQRSEFLRQMIELDYRSWSLTTPNPAVEKKPESPEPVVAEVVPEQQAEATDESMIDFVIDWIAERTGYPREFVTPDKKLRDDLNLDSIKAGELALMLSKKMGRELPFDLGVVANASIEYLVNSVSEFEGQRISMDDSLTNDWVKSFGIEPLPAPIGMEEQIGLAGDGVMLVIDQEAPSPRSQALLEALAANSVNTKQLTLNQAISEPLDGNLAGVALILQEQQQAFFDLQPSQFKVRLEGFATALFQLMQKLLPLVEEREEFRFLVIRPSGESDPGADLDGAAGFLKTISLEFEKPGFNWKWLSLPVGWEPAEVAECALTELRHLGERIEYHYSETGERLSPTTVQLAASKQKAPRLGGLDTLLVSGGGKGITFEMAFALAQKAGVKLGLLGSSPLPADDDNESELASNLKRLHGKGIRHLYLQVDITRHGEVQDAVRQIERKLGRVSAILHGAGISRFSEFREMELENYLQCIRVKATGLFNLLAVVPPKRLKALHVISSVLGRTGMFRQADYTFANAWLDAATLAVARSHPRLHGFSLGYSVWQEIGIGAKSGSLKMLQNVGVTPVSVAQGIEAYLNLVSQQQPCTTYVCTGRLNPDVERRLMPTLKLPAWRFLENVRRFVPTVELVAEASLSHAKDRYVLEHVFAGTPLMPTVMGLEAMSQAAMACIGSMEVPVIRQVTLNKPMIIPEETGTVVRIQALCEPTVDGVTHVQVRMSSDSDGFATDHFEIRCVFGLPQPDPQTLPMLPVLPAEPYAKSPEDFAPVPLFQGRFLRRISKILAIREDEETLTELTVPVQARYYDDDFEQQTRTPSPAIRDSMLQAAALMAPPGYLPESIEEERFFRPLQEGEKLLCWARGVNRGRDELKADILLFDQAGSPVEWMQGLVVKATSTQVDLQGERKTKSLAMDRIEESLRSVITGSPLSLAMAHDTELLQEAALKLLPAAERETLLSGVTDSRAATVLTNMLATRKSAISFFRDTLKTELTPTEIGIRHEQTGKPLLVFNRMDGDLPDLDISLTDSHGASAAAIGRQPVGIDIEAVENRDTETWNGLLGDDGYRLALELQRQTGESFDIAATRVWTLIEAGKKANGLERRVPRYDRIVDTTWLVFSAQLDSKEQLLSALLENHGDDFVVSLAAGEIQIQGQEETYE
ncbi:MAG: SDR family NAD(P)-dependent oxidoreductase, partial [Pseudomonadota bacterium]